MATEVSHGHHDGHDHGHDAHHHITPPSVYITSFAALLALMVLTIVASKLHLGVANNFVAMAIAVVKASIVVMFFMQVKYGTKLTWLWAGLGFVWVLLIFLIVSDYFTRDWIPLHGWQQVHGPLQR